MTASFIKNIFNQDPCINMNIKYLFVFLFCLVFFIIVLPYCVKYHNYLHQPLVYIGNCPLDCWSLSHFLSYTFIGFLFPHYWKLIMIISIGWEIFEYIGHHIEKRLFSKEKIYWCAKYSDIAVNIFGFIFGLLLRVLFSFLIHPHTT